MNTEPLVKGKITFEEVTPPFTGATIFVRLERITAADIASEAVADYVKRDVAFDPKTTSDLSFAIAGDPPDPRVSYAVRVHIDIDGDGAVSKGDFISMQSYPVITFGHPREVSILVRQVK
jgi:Type III secretion system lipoprotein chaperone (YscW)